MDYFVLFAESLAALVCSSCGSVCSFGCTPLGQLSPKFGGHTSLLSPGLLLWRDGAEVPPWQLVCDAGSPHRLVSPWGCSVLPLMLQQPLCAFINWGTAHPRAGGSWDGQSWDSAPDILDFFLSFSGTFISISHQQRRLHFGAVVVCLHSRVYFLVLTDPSPPELSLKLRLLTQVILVLGFGKSH